MSTPTQPAAPAVPIRAPEAQNADPLLTLQQVYEAFGIGEQARTPSTLMMCVSNTLRFTAMLHAIEREFFMVPGEPDEDYPDEEPQPECLVNCWGSTVPEYVAQFGAALASLEAARSSREWISVKDRLPDAPLFIVRSSRSDDEATEGIDQFEGMWVVCNAGVVSEERLRAWIDRHQVTHWMPLPPIKEPVTDAGGPKSGSKDAKE